MKKHILISGTHRSGTTWVGNVLSSSNQLCYIYEPFNNRNKKYSTPVVNQYECINEYSLESRKKDFMDYMKNQFEFSSLQFQERCINEIGVKNKLRGSLREFSKFVIPRKLIKDPLALLSLPWIVENFQITPIVIIRHPCAFVESHFSRGWRFSFDHLLNQEEVRPELEPFMSEINSLSGETDDIIPRAAIWWKILHTRILSYQKEYDWMFYKHEDLSINPIDNFKEIFSKSDLPFNNSVNRYIKSSTQAKVSNSKFRRNSKDLAFKWKKKLSPSQINLILNITQPLYQEFYEE